jgi:hypothetical protein
MGLRPAKPHEKAPFVLLSIHSFTRRDELWGRFLTCGGLSIRLPHLYAPATALENRHHSLRLAAMWGRQSCLRL